MREGGEGGRRERGEGGRKGGGGRQAYLHIIPDPEDKFPEVWEVVSHFSYLPPNQQVTQSHATKDIHYIGKTVKRCLDFRKGHNSVLVS